VGKPPRWKRDLYYTGESGVSRTREREGERERERESEGEGETEKRGEAGSYHGGHSRRRSAPCLDPRRAGGIICTVIFAARDKSLLVQIRRAASRGDRERERERAAREGRRVEGEI
jgi:hypothetical protein